MLQQWPSFVFASGVLALTCPATPLAGAEVPSIRLVGILLAQAGATAPPSSRRCTPAPPVGGDRPERVTPVAEAKADVIATARLTSRAPYMSPLRVAHLNSGFDEETTAVLTSLGVALRGSAIRWRTTSLWTAMGTPRS